MVWDLSRIGDEQVRMWLTSNYVPANTVTRGTSTPSKVSGIRF